MEKKFCNNSLDLETLQEFCKSCFLCLSSLFSHVSWEETVENVARPLSVEKKP